MLELGGAEERSGKTTCSTRVRVPESEMGGLDLDRNEVCPALHTNMNLKRTVSLDGQKSRTTTTWNLLLDGTLG